MLTIAIQAGGESRRMGQDKALLPFLGRPLVERVVNRLRPVADELLVTTNHPEHFAFLDVPLIPDKIRDRGALGGLYTALSAASQPLVAVVACDMPFASPRLIELQRDLLLDPQLDAVIPRSGAAAEPFHAVYRKETCLPAVEAALQAGKWRADSWFPQARLRFLSSAEIAPLDPDGRIFWNVNTPEEFQEAEQAALHAEQP